MFAGELHLGPIFSYQYSVELCLPFLTSYSSLQNVIIPRLKSWVRKVVFEEDEETNKKINLKANLEQEAAAAAKAAAAAAADVARVSQEMLVSKSEGEFITNIA